MDGVTVYCMGVFVSNRMTKGKRNILMVLEGASHALTATQIAGAMGDKGLPTPALSNLVVSLQGMLNEGLLSLVDGGVSYFCNRRAYNDSSYDVERDAKAYCLPGQVFTRGRVSNDFLDKLLGTV